MKKQFLRVLSIILSLTLFLGIMPLSVLAEIGLPKGDYDGLILEFDSYNAMYEFREDNGGKELGGNMLLVDGTYSDAQRYDTMAHITSVTYNYTVEAASVVDEYATTPDDPRFEEQTYPNSTAVWQGIASVADNYEGVYLHDIRVGVIDSGIDATHEDLKNRVVAGYDAVNETAIAAGVNSDVALDSHGTKVAGLIAAESHNGIGIAGVSGKYPIQLVPLRALNENGNGKIADIIKAIYWAIDNNVDILNMSFGVRLSYYPAALANAVSDAYENGVFMVAAAGNEGNKTFKDYYPACLDNVRVALAASDPDSNEKAHYSNDAVDKGNAYVGFKYTGVCGTDLLTTTAGNGYDTFTGTSASCAVITGYYAMMLSLTGGRTNPNAYRDLGYVFQRAMAEGALFNHYNAKPDRLRSAILNYLDDSILFANQNSFKSVLECDSIVVGNTTVTGRIVTGAHLVGDATLYVYDSDDKELYRSEPIPNDGSNPTEYTFPLSVMDMKDGDARVEIRFRTPEEVENDYESAWTSMWAYKYIYIKNSLIAKEAQIVLYDAEGNDIFATVHVFNPETGELVKTIQGNSYSTASDYRIPRADFNGGKLAFAAFSNGVMYYVESEFKDEIVLGGDTAQMTTLHFAGMTKTMKNAKVYANTKVGVFQVGTTDDEGDVEILMMEGDYDLLVVDEASRYIVSAHLSQDGAVLEATFADEIDGAEPYTLAVTSKLADNDYYSVGVSTQPVNNLAAAATLGWIPVTEPTIYVTPGTYYVQVGIYDTILEDSSISRYFSTVHGIGQVNLPADEIDFDPTVLIATTPVAKYELDYGDKQYITFSLIDDKGYAVYGGDYYYVGDEGTISDASKWEGYQYAATYDADGNEYNSVDVDEDWAAGTRDYFFTATGRYETLPAKEATYTVEIEMKNYTFSSDETGMLPYTHQTTTIEFVVKVGKILRVSCNEPENYNWVSVGFVYAYIDGEAKMLTRFGEEYNESDDSFTLIYDARELVDGTPIMVSASGYNQNIGATIDFYSIVDYDISNPNIVVTPPEKAGKLWMTLDGEDIYGLQATIPYGDATFTFEMNGDNYYAYPVGKYTLSGFASIGDWSDEYECWLNKYISIDTAITITEDAPEQPIELFSDDMESIIITPDSRQWEFQLSTIDENGVRGPITSVQSGGDTCMVLRTPGSKDILLSAIPKEWGTTEALGYTVELDFFYSNVELPELEDFAAFEVMADQASFTAEEDVTVSLHAYVSDGLRLRDLFLMKYEGQMGEGGEMSPGVVAGHYYPTIRYRQMGGEWSEPVAMDNWKSANLGKLAPGAYQARIEFAGVDEYNVPQRGQTCNFTVSGDMAAHEVHLDAPETAGEEVKISIRGNAGAEITVSYTTPSGATKELDAITLPANGMGSVTVALTEEGDYIFSARSVLDGNAVNASPVTVACDFGVPEKVENFRAIPEGSNALRLSWDVPAGATRVWLFRNGVTMGYVEAEYNSYLDKNLSLGSIYTYSIIPEGANGRSGEATFTTGQPVVEKDVTAPTAPVALSVKSEKMSAVLSWTRATDNVRVVYYYLYRDGEQIAILLKRNYVDDGLTKNTTYNYTVTAVDAEGNESAPSPVATLTTPASYELEVQVELERGKTGVVTGEKLTIHADAGRDANKVTAVIEYVSKDEAGVQTATVDLTKAGLYWRADWKIQRVQEVKSIVVHSYEGETEVASKAAEGFPCLLSSALNFTLTIHNAPYAKKALASAKIILTDTKNGYKYSLPVNTDSETCLYEFKGLSAGQYRIQVLWDDKTLYTAKNISVGTSAAALHSADIDNFVRIKETIGLPMYHFFDDVDGDNIIGMDVLENQELTEDGYLSLEGDTAFYIAQDHRLVVQLPYSEQKNVIEYNDRLYDGNSVSTSAIFYYTPGVYEFSTPAISDYTEIESMLLKLNDISNTYHIYLQHDEKMIANVTVPYYGRMSFAFDHPDTSWVRVPKTDKISVEIEGKEFYSDSGVILDKTVNYRESFDLEGDGPFQVVISPKAYTWKDVKFSVQAFYAELDTMHTFKGDIEVDVAYNERFIVELGDTHKVLVPPTGYISVRWRFNRSDRPANAEQDVTSFWHSVGIYVDEVTDINGLVSCQMDAKLTKAYPHSMQVEFKDLSGFVDWSEVTVTWVDARGMHTEELEINKDGNATLNAHAYLTGVPDPDQLYTQQVSFSSPYVNIATATVPLNVGAAVRVYVEVTDIKFQFNYDPAIDYFIAFYHDDETYNFKYLQTNQPTNSDRAAFNGDLDKTWNGGVTVPMEQVYTMHMVVLPISKWAETEDGYSTYYSYRLMSYEDILPYAIFERTYTRDDLKADGEKRYYQLENKYKFRRLDMGDITLYDRDGNLMPTVEDGSTFLYIKQKSTGKYMLLKERNEAAKDYWVEDVEHFLLVYLPPCIDHQFEYNMTGQVVTNWWVNTEGNILLNDIETYLKHFAPYCTIIEPEDISRNQRIYLDVEQANYEVQLLRSDGTVPEKAVAEIAIFDGDTHVTSVRGDNKLTVPACAPGHKLTAYVLWKDPDSSIVDLSNVYNLKSQPAVKVYELDLSQPRTEPFILVNDEEPVLQYKATDGLSTQIRSVTPEKDGQFRVRLLQFPANDLVNPVIMVLPEGAHDIYVDKYLHEDGREITVNNWRGINVEFLISAADFEADNTIEIYIENSKTGTRFFQFYRTIEYDNFSYGYNDLASTNDVRFVTPTDVALTNYTGKAYQVNIFGLQGTYGETFGDVWKREYGSSGGVLTLDYSTDIDESMTWQEYIDSNPWRGGQNIGETEIYEGKWMGFHSDAEDFAIGIKVDDLPLMYTLPEGITMDPTAYGQAPHGYDEERGVYWINKAFLERVKHYRENTGDGMVFIPMAEPETYPHTYRIQLDYCYVDMDGVMQYEQYKDESIRIHYNAPVLKSFKFEGLVGTGVRRNGDLNSTVYTAITSTAERAAFEQHVLTRATQSERMVSGTYRVKAYFGEPDMTGFNHTEIASVYAVATGVSKNCTNRSFELTWDEAEQCFVGVGILGDQSETPDSITVVYTLAGTVVYDGKPTMQMNDVDKTDENVQAMSKQENLVEVAPDNGWSMEKTNEMWALYAASIADGRLTEEEIAAFTDENRRLYLPKIQLFDENGDYIGSNQRYIQFKDLLPEGQTITAPIKFAVMDGAEYQGTLYADIEQVDSHTITITTTSDNLSMILPQYQSEVVQAAAALPVIGAMEYIGAGFEFVSAMAAVDAVASTPDTVIGAINQPDWVNDLPADAHADYNAMVAEMGLLSATENAVGFAGLPGAIVSTVAWGVEKIWFEDVRAEAIANYKKLAEANRELQETLQKLQELEQDMLYLNIDREFMERFNEWMDNYDEFSHWEAEYIWQLFENWKTYDWWYINNGIEFASKGYPPIAVCDPSGFVFEGYEENRLEDVTATLYYLNEETGQWVKWNSMYYNEGPNPNITGSDGKYGWDVTHGKWKVVYEKDGYYLSESAELDVPPPHMDVNIGLVSQSAATLKEVIPGKGGAYVDIVFDRPVLVEDAIAMLNVYFSGETVDGTISALNGGKTSNGIKLGESAPTIDADKNVACTFRFVPDEALEVGTFIHVEAKEGVETYNGMLCAAIVSDYVQVPEQGSDPITSIIYTGENETLEIGETLNLFGNLEIVGDLGDIVWTANNPEIATVDENGIVTAVSGGTAFFIAACGELETVAVVVVNPAPHVCVYDQKITVDGCLATKATEEAAATYYYVCTCGAVGTETYTHGEPLAHTHQYVDWDHDETDHWRVCACGDVATVGKFAHTWVDGVCEQCGAVREVCYSILAFGGNSVSEDVRGLAFRFLVSDEYTDLNWNADSNLYIDYNNCTVTPTSSGTYKLVSMGAVLSNNGSDTYLDNVNSMTVMNVVAEKVVKEGEDAPFFAIRVVNIPEAHFDTVITARSYFVYENEFGEQIVVYGEETAATYNSVLNG